MTSRGARLVRPPKSTADAEWRRFELKGNLAVGGMAAAYPRDRDGTLHMEPEDVFLVYDTEGAWYGVGRDNVNPGGGERGAWGKARRWADSQQWEVETLEYP